MKKFVSSVIGLVLFGSFAATSGAFASTDDGAEFARAIDIEIADQRGIVQEEAINIVEPCSTQTMRCEVTWKADSDQCKSNCTTRYQGDHASLDEAKERCEHIHGVTLGSGVLSCGPCWVLNSTQGDCLEHCKDLCYTLWEKCRDNCPRKDKNCLAECSNALGQCNRECDRKCR
jgi:hypothetical protein